MKPPATPPATPHPDWLHDCGFQSRQDPHDIAPGILGHKANKPPRAGSFQSLLPIDRGTTKEKQTPFSLSETYLQPTSAAAPVAPVTGAPTVPNDQVLSELRTLRQLSSGVFSPETNRDFLPEVVLFALIGLLGAAWPILSMLGVMAKK